MADPPDKPPDDWWPGVVKCVRRVPLAATALLLLLLVTALAAAVQPAPQQQQQHLHLRHLQNNESSPSPTTCTLSCCTSTFSTDDLCPSDNEWISSIPNAVQILLIALLLFLSAMFSGLTLGLMGLDKTGLEIVMEGDDVKNARAARRIYPVRSNGNLLLCTLLLGNVAVNALLSILLADKAGGTVGFVASTFLIVIFGEILPQATCSRYALEIGSRSVPLVKVCVVLLYVVAKPLSMALDWALGEELATTYSNAEMRKLLEIHVQEGRFDQETAGAMQGALQYKHIAVKEVMTPIEHVFMLNVDNKLDFETIATIFKAGYSRIPVYEISYNNIIGLLFVKDLIFVDPEDETPVRNFVQIFGRGVHVVWPDDKLGDVLRVLKQGRSHMAVVRDVNNQDETQDPFYEVKGIITLEDIIEEIIGDEIVDETDAFVDGTHSQKVNRMQEDFDWGRLRLLDAKIVDEMLSLEEVRAVVAHLRTNYPDTMSLLSDHQLQRLVEETPVTQLVTAEQEVMGAPMMPPTELMYERGTETDTCTLLLSGKVTVLAGQDLFRSDVSSWTVLATSALTEPEYRPDFTAFVSAGPCRCLRLTRDRYTAAVDASTLERRSSHNNKEEAHRGNNDATRRNGPPERSKSLDAPAMTAAAAAAATTTMTSAATATTTTGQQHAHRGSTQTRRNKLIAALRKATKSKGRSTDDEPSPEGTATTSEAVEPSTTTTTTTVGFVTTSGASVPTVSLRATGGTMVSPDQVTTAAAGGGGASASGTTSDEPSSPTFQYIESSSVRHADMEKTEKDE